jgi:hypothetical protein
MAATVPMRVACAVVLVVLSCAGSLAQAREDRAIVLEDAPIMLLPDATRTPLRVAAKGTSLVMLENDGEWLRVEFQDPQYGLRFGYIEARFVRIVPGQGSRTAQSGAAGADVATAQPDVPAARRVRQGAWFNVGVGVGSLGCDSCAGRSSGLSGGLSAGGTLGDKWLLGVGTTGWSGSIAGETVTAGTLDVRVRFYPALRSGFFITGGFGVGGISMAGDSEFGAGAILGVGWDIRLGSKVSLTPFYNGFAMRSSTVDANVGQLGLGITIQ